MDKLKGLLRRQKQNILQRMGWRSGTEDDQFAEAQAKFEKLENGVTRLSGHAVAIQTHLNAILADLSLISDDIGEIYELGDPLRVVALKLKDFTSNIEKDTKEQLDSVMNNTVISALAVFLSKTPAIRQVIEERKEALLEYDFRRSKVEKLTQQPSDDPATFPRAKMKCENAKRLYDERHAEAMRAIGQLLDAKNPELDPAILAMLKQTVQYFSETSSVLSLIQPYLDNPEYDAGSSSRDPRYKIAAPPPSSAAPVSVSAPAVSASSSTPNPTIAQMPAASAASAAPASKGGSAFSSFSSMHSALASESSTPAAGKPQQLASAPAADDFANFADGNNNNSNNNSAAVDSSSAPSGFGDEWFWLSEDNDQFGPFTFKQMKEQYKSKKINDSTYIYSTDSEGLESWVELSAVPHIKAAFAK